MECGFAVDVTRTLDEAAAALDCARYDILLLELALPDGDGLDWLKQLRRNGRSMPAMVISGLNDLDRRIASFNGGRTISCQSRCLLLSSSPGCEPFCGDRSK